MSEKDLAAEKENERIAEKNAAIQARYDRNKEAKLKAQEKGEAAVAAAREAAEAAAAASAAAAAMSVESKQPAPSPEFLTEDRVTVNWENGAKGDRKANWTQTYPTWPVPGLTPWRLRLNTDGTLDDTAGAPGKVDYTYVSEVGSQERGGFTIEAEVAELGDVYLYTIDDLKGVVQENRQSRETAAREAEKIIDVQVLNFMRWIHGLDAVPTIRALREQADSLRERELKRAHQKLARGEDPAKVLEQLARTLTNKLTHAPTDALRHADLDGELLDAARRLFNLNED